MVCPGPENRKLKGGGEYLSVCIVIVACVNPKTNLFKAVFLFFEPFLPVQKHRRTKK